MAGAGTRAEAGAPAEAGARADADARFGERLAREIEGVLGVGIAVNEVAVDGPGEGAGEGAGEGPATIHATCLVDGQARELVGTGDTLLEAARDLIRAAAELRLASAWWRLVGPT